MIATRRSLRASVFVVALALITVAPPPSTANAANCVMADLQPTLAQFMVTQGVGDSQTAFGYGTLTRGKETLVKLFLTLPLTCAVGNSQFVNITNASLTLSTGTAPNTLFTGYGSTPALPPTIQGNSAADPVFVVPSANVAPASNTGSFAPTFMAIVTFSRSDGTSTQTGQTRTFSNNTKTFERLTNALRIYLVPMGDKSKAFNTQYTPADQAIVQNAMQTLSRIYPTSAGVADLTVAGGGVRYVVDTATMLDLASIPGAYVNGKFCGTAVNFSAIKALLAQYLLAHNTANKRNPTAIADRVVGVVGGNSSPTGPISSGTEDGTGCADGMASVSSAESWIRLIADQTGKPSRSGSLAAMEISHTFGLELNQATYHSPAVEADGGRDRAYNISNRARIEFDHTVMDFNNTGSPWDDTTTLYDPTDFAYMLCQLAPGTLSVTCSPGKIGSSVGVPAGEQYVIAGTTDGTPENTKVVEPYYDLDERPTAEDPASLLRLIQLDTSGASPTLIPGLNFGVPWSPAVSNHGTIAGTIITSGARTFYAAAPGGFTDQGAGEVRLVKVSSPAADPLGGTILFSSTKVDPPAITSITGAPIATTGGTSTLFRTQITPRIPPKPDIVFLADTTGSMDGPISDVRDHIDRIAQKVRDAQPNAMFGAASYKDYLPDDNPVVCGTATADPYVFRIEQSLTDDVTALKAAIADTAAGWHASGGCDEPEAQLNALYRLGVGNDGNIDAPKQVGYRDGSSRVIAWFGDAPGHDPSAGNSLQDAIDALNGNGIRVIAVNVGRLDSAPSSADCHSSTTDCSGQATKITHDTGGVLKTNDADQVADAILAGLHDLDATVMPSYNGGSCGPISITFDPVQKTVQPGGTPVDFTEHVTVAATSAGTYTCRVFFKINGEIVQKSQGGDAVNDPAYYQDVSVVVSDAPRTAVTIEVAKSSDRPLLLDLIFECNSFNFVAAVAVTPSTQDSATATFTINADTSNACAQFGGGGKLAPYVSDGWNRVGGTVLTYPLSVPKAPTAAIYTPSIVTAINWDGTLALRGSGEIAGIELPGSALTWSITAPNGTTTVRTEHVTSLDIAAPMPNGWTQGTWTVTLTVTYEGRTAIAQRTFGAYYQFTGFFNPVVNPPQVNTGNAGKAFSFKWQLRSGATIVSDLSTVLSTKYALVTTCSPTPGVTFAATSGGSDLRFDSSSMQFRFNWKTPTQPGLYLFRLTLTDGTTHDACVRLT